MQKNKLFIITAATLLGMAFLMFSFEKFHVTNFYEKPVSAVSESPRPVNSVDYTPQTSPPDPTINSVKNPGDTVTAPTPSNVSLTIVRANQDATTKNLNVSVLVDGTNSGACKLELMHGTTTVVTKTANITEQSGLTTCAGFTVMADEIPAAGTYTVKVNVGDANVTQNKELTK